MPPDAQAEQKLRALRDELSPQGKATLHEISRVMGLAGNLGSS